MIDFMAEVLDGPTGRWLVGKEGPQAKVRNLNWRNIFGSTKNQQTSHHSCRHGSGLP
jgi:hypothetical protein